MKSMKRESAVNVQYMQVHCTDQCIIESVVSHYLFTTADADNTTHMPRIENLQEVTTVNDSLHNVVAFSFDLFTGDVNISSADSSTIFQLRWETANKEASGLITPTVTKGRGFNQTNHSNEGAVTYNFIVDATTLGRCALLSHGLRHKYRNRSVMNGSSVQSAVGLTRWCGRHSCIKR